MRHPALIICERDGRLAERLRELSETHRWQLRLPHAPEDCLQAVSRGGPAVVVVKVGRDLVTEMSLVRQLADRAADVRVIVVGDTENPVLTGLAWDLGADFVLFPPLARDLLPDVVRGLLEAAVQRGEPSHA